MNAQSEATSTMNLPRYQAIPKRIFELLGQAETVLMTDLANPGDKPASAKLKDIHERIHNLVRDGVEEAV